MIKMLISLSLSSIFIVSCETKVLELDKSPEIVNNIMTNPTGESCDSYSFLKVKAKLSEVTEAGFFHLPGQGTRLERRYKGIAVLNEEFSQPEIPNKLQLEFGSRVIAGFEIPPAGEYEMVIAVRDSKYYLIHLGGKTAITHHCVEGS